MALGERIQARLAALNMSQNRLAGEVGVSTQTIWKLVNGQSQTTGHLHKIARALNTTPEYLDGETDDDSPTSRLPAAVKIDENDDSIEIDLLDLAYGMGGTFLDTDDAVSVEKLKFSRALIRRFTAAPPEFLFIAEGIGDSMAPTINDREMVVVDRSQRIPKAGDLIWAISFGGVGMFKRLRPMPDGTMKIMSDNPNVSDERATDGELFIVGRVITAFRNL